MSIPNEDRLRDQHDRRFNAGGRNSPYYEGDEAEDEDDEEEEEKDAEAELDNGATEAEERFGVVGDESKEAGQAAIASGDNLDTKVLELRDHGTFIPVLAIDINPRNDRQRYLMRRVGYACDGRPNVILTRLSGDGQATNDPYAWEGGQGGPRTFPVAHNWIIDHWAELADGDVVDVEWILGEKGEKKSSEREEAARRAEWGVE